MEFKLSKEQLLIQKTAKEFADTILADNLEEIEKTNEVPEVVLDALREYELGGIPHKVEYGGGGGDYLSYALTLEQLGRYSTGAASYITINNLSMNAIAKFGTEEMRKKYMPDHLALKVCGCFAFTEPGTGSDPKSITTTAVRDGDEYVLNGTKRFITNAHMPGVLVVFAKDEVSGFPTAFVVEKLGEGYSIGEPWNKMGWLGSHTYDVFLKDVRIPVENQIGELGGGFKILRHNIGFGKLSISSLALGRAQGALEEAIEYAKTRTRRGVPISSFPTLQYRIAEMSTQVEAARTMVYRLAWLAENMSDLDVLAAEAAKTKLFATTVATNVARDAMQVLGSYGAMKDYRVEQLLRDSALGELVEGVADVQHVIIAGQIFKK